jgi:hypothetical protein
MFPLLGTPVFAFDHILRTQKADGCSHQTLNAIGRTVPGAPFTISTCNTASRFFCLQSGGIVSKNLPKALGL